MQATSPAVLYLPATHSMHTLTVLAAATVEYVPSAQLMQTPSPAALYVPAAHSEQLV